MYTVRAMYNIVYIMKTGEKRKCLNRLKVF